MTVGEAPAGTSPTDVLHRLAHPRRERLTDWPSRRFGVLTRQLPARAGRGFPDTNRAENWFVSHSPRFPRTTRHGPTRDGDRVRKDPGELAGPNVARRSDNLSRTPVPGIGE
jgi:hypothetical protein